MRGSNHEPKPDLKCPTGIAVFVSQFKVAGGGFLGGGVCMICIDIDYLHPYPRVFESVLGLFHLVSKRKQPTHDTTKL